MRIKFIIIYYLRYAWELAKTFLRSIKLLFTSLLPFTGLTIILSIIQGLILGPWYHGTEVDQLHFLMKDMVNVQTGEWLKMPGGQNPLYYSRAPYYIPQLQNPLKWTKDIGISRPVGWHTENAGRLTEFRNLYRARRRYSDDPSWHHWIYLSENKQPLNESWNEDPWDKAFQELLEHRDKHEPLGRANFNYLTCRHSFLCAFWYISGPALVHFTNEPVNQSLTDRPSRKRILDPVSVRVFELPLKESVIPDAFPTRFEQMRSITASNSTYWTTRTAYSNFEQVSGQARKVLKGYEEKYPLTYGMLAKAEHKLIRLIGADDTIIHLVPQLVSFLAAAVPSRSGSRMWREVQLWWRKRQYEKSTKGNVQRETDKAANDPVAYQLQYILDSMTDEDKEKFGKTYRGEVLLERLKSGLDKKDWDGREDIIKQLEDAFVP
ncbi:hypothetical protein FVEN_g6464 [Fusarium venenatum]|uniref:Uncharacterized protein n=1 Tax=Fusarium venenatum TaxID=56646 RepID=A0A2L2SZB5_9HYPO|nr:uncharacterized protein FVRRES_04739 [Fusarium venenatum]KAG8355674.1 hypothetical protein FVEN_g6464 [Fusarium venenatum]KAH6991888.1 hypothetical protein EDB82DRAFT_473715 [Fusarium venenatum]CEI60303.1 unnamed protein product [Fusarium venenatum]